MKVRFNLKLGLFCILLSLLLVAPALGQGTSQPASPPAEKGVTKPAAPAASPGMAPEHHLAPGETKKEEKFREKRLQLIKELKLAPDKEKAVLAVEDKYAGERKEIIEKLKKAKEELKKALAAPKPDEAKVKEQVDSLTSGMDALFNSFKSQREEEFAQMTPIEQGKYLMMLAKLHEKMSKGKKGHKK